MDARSLLEELLQSGRQLADQGQQYAEQKLGVPASGEQREAMLSGMQKGALAAGALALLLGTRGGRRLGGAALKLGSLAAVGGIAYKAYQNWQRQAGREQPALPVNELAGEAAERRSLLLLKALIAAAKADGHIDEAELGRIRDEMERLGLGESAVEFFRAEAAKPLNVEDVVAGVDDPETAAEVYLATRLVIDEQNTAERDWLMQVRRALKLDDALVAELDGEVR